MDDLERNYGPLLKQAGRLETITFSLHLILSKGRVTKGPESVSRSGMHGVPYTFQVECPIEVRNSSGEAVAQFKALAEIYREFLTFADSPKAQAAKWTPAQESWSRFDPMTTTILSVNVVKSTLPEWFGINYGYNQDSWNFA